MARTLRYELIDVLTQNQYIADEQLGELFAHLTSHHITELRDAARKRSRLHRLCQQALDERQPPQASRTGAAVPQHPSLLTDEELANSTTPRRP